MDWISNFTGKLHNYGWSLYIMAEIKL